MKEVIAARFSSEIEANIACGMLADNGIEARVASNNMATLYGAGSTWAPVELYVAADSLAKALELLKSHGDI
ncbi:MAG: DUF2007 domain-containing protein [Muribaculaceae bacterium]|nr:DUF2007 domain-containing protein [Muribaculaceae bacterium]